MPDLRNGNSNPTTATTMNISGGRLDAATGFVVAMALAIPFWIVLISVTWFTIGKISSNHNPAPVAIQMNIAPHNPTQPIFAANLP